MYRNRIRRTVFRAGSTFRSSDSDQQRRSEQAMCNRLSSENASMPQPRPQQRPPAGASRNGPLDDIATTDIVWCIAYTWGVGGASYIAQ